MRLKASVITLGICIYNAGSTELSLLSLPDENGITSVSSSLIASKEIAGQQNGPSTSTAQQMILLANWVGQQSGSEVISQSAPIVTQDLETLNFPSASYILAKAYHDHDDAQQDDRIWISENSAHWRHQLIATSESNANTKWFIQPVELLLSGDDDDDAFCVGMPMVMAMGGFQWSLGKTKGKPDCLNYFVPAWKLDDSGRFWGAMVYSFLLGIMTEGITNFQIWMRPHLGKGRLRKIIMPLLYATQQWLGYIVMMVTMSYSFELFASVLVGLMVGRLLFLQRSATRPIISTTSDPVAGVGPIAAAVENEDTPLLDRGSSVRRRRR